MFRSVTFEKGQVTEEQVVRDRKAPVVKTPPKPRRKLVRWLEWIVVAALVVGVGAIGYVLLSDDATEIRTDLLGTRYRETGVPTAVAPAAVVLGPAAPMYPADAAQLEAITNSYLSQIAEPDFTTRAVLPDLSALTSSYFSQIAEPDFTTRAVLPDLSALTYSYFSQIAEPLSGPAPSHGEGLPPVSGRHGGPL